MKGAEEVGEALKGQESDPLFSDATHLSPPFLMAGRPARQQHFIWRMKAGAYTMEEKKKIKITALGNQGYFQEDLKHEGASLIL